MNDFDLKEQLMLLRSGDRAAFERIYAELSTPIYMLLLRMTNDRMLAEDILQDFFIKLFQSVPGENVRNPRAYLYRTARNLAIDALRKNVNTDMICEDICAEEEDITERIDLENAIKRLDRVDIQIISMHIYGDLRFREISLIMEMPLGTVLWRYRRAINLMKNLLNGGMK